MKGPLHGVSGAYHSKIDRLTVRAMRVGEESYFGARNHFSSALA
jgi:hypothetical protein